jgi:hypothetical protein
MRLSFAIGKDEAYATVTTPDDLVRLALFFFSQHYQFSLAKEASSSTGERLVMLLGYVSSPLPP